MAVQAKEVKHRLRSIKNTQKITKAMELVAASKMRKAVAAAQMSRRYSSLALDIIRRLVVHVDITKYPQLQQFLATSENTTRSLVVVFSSNRGLCGAFNSHIVRSALSYIAEHPQENVDVISIGKKGAAMFGSAGIAIHALYEKEDMPKDDRTITNIADMVLQRFTDGTVAKVLIAYTNYHSPVHQTVAIRQLFPFALDDAVSATLDDDTTQQQTKEQALAPTREYIYEPDQHTILGALLPRMAQLQLYQALLESNASEHSSRMVAMKNATDAAGDMADEFILLFNQARQAAITKEIAEISAAMAALT